jgi:OHCU decarboxylase
LSAELDRLNTMPAGEAEAAFLQCCGSTKWAQKMAQKRPYRDLGEICKAADRVWWSLRREDWLEAFGRHPKIGERAAAKPSGVHAQQWSEQEQSSAAGARQDVLAELTAANRAYQDRFGYIFIVCATGKTREEMLALLKQRLQNDPNAELRIAAEEQRRITRLRLEKLLQVDAKP